MHYKAICLILIITLGLVGLPPFITSARVIQSAFAQATAPPVSSAAAGGQQQQHQGQRPNILLIVGDDFGFSDIGAFGAEIKTPNLDQLAKEGRVAYNYHTAPTCSPARVALLTGVDWHLGGLGNMYELISKNQEGKPGYETYINNKVVTIAQLLKDGGYHTIQTGKWHLSGNHTPFQPGTSPYDVGFERSFTLVGDSANHFTNGSIFPGGHNTFIENNTVVDRPGNNTLFSNNLYTDKMIENINKIKGDGKPLFMYLAFQVAHSPFMATAGSITKYDKIYSAGWDKIREQRFEKQKELGMWPANMTLPNARPPNVPWTSLTSDEKQYATRLLAVRASMIENMDQNIGKLIQYLKQIGKYDDTLIVFTSDNGGSEAVQLPEGILALNGVDYRAIPGFVHNFLNDTVSNLGNKTTSVNFGAWGPYVSGAPLAGFKASEYEGGTRVPFVVKVPLSKATTTGGAAGANLSSPIRSFMFLTDLTPTFLDYAGVKPAGTTYKGNPVHTIMGKSIRPILNGSAESIHGANDPTGTEMFNNTAVWEGPYVATIDASHNPGKWQLYNIVNDPGQNNDIAAKQPEQLQKMIADYQKYAQKVGVVIPTGDKAKLQYSKIYPPLNQSQTIHLDEIFPPFKPPLKTLASQVLSY